MHRGMFLQIVLTIFAAQTTYAGFILEPRHGGHDNDHDIHPVNNYTYAGPTGPLGWAGLNSQYGACSTSDVQSPINLDSSINLSPSPPTVKIGGGLPWGTTTYEGKEYKLEQFHFHTPSEHLIESEYFPMEVHFVHKAADNSSLALGALFELTMDGSTTDLLTVLTKSLKKIYRAGSVTETGPLDFKPIERFFHTTPFYNYVGSLTAPPCTSGLTWLVAKRPLPINVPTFLAFKSLLKFNARYPQNAPGQTNLIKLAAKELPR
ncbi:hypothetical protein D9615_009249 [Tricholomella constricta]|uniref:Carbonic anhydrase n=1 Tax=Tricholomella constricta TaxID=117010 RepID=A0A8H5LWV9_9AGAR|nr:hypothetical protein D9615_009249 [Tricholomella constricta]